MSLEGLSWREETESRYVCEGCGQLIEMEVWVDSRRLGRLPNGEFVTLQVPALADPPPRPTVYRCRFCQRLHVGSPPMIGSAD